MDYEKRLENSYYNTVAAINSAHNIDLVQHRESGKIYIRKTLDVYNLHIYEYLLEHPINGIPRLHNLYEENGQLILIEDFISGTSLQEIIDTQALTLDLIVRFMVELCSILEKLHMPDPPIIHRDIKPSNIIITPYNHVCLIDFNAAKYLNDTAAHDTVLLGTKGYAAPEQYGFGFSTPQTDIYALGILLRELSSALPVPTNRFDAIIRKCTEMNPADRMETVQELKTEIEKLQICNSQKTQRSMPSTWKDLIPPGFRTKKTWKMLSASTIYFFIFWLCLILEIKDASVVHLWIERIIVLFMMLSIVFCCFNYCNIQRFAPLHTNKYWIVRCFGVLILNFNLILSLFAVMFLLESIF